MTWKHWLAIILLLVILYFITNTHKKCKQRGDKLGKPYRCKIFSSEPIAVIAQDNYYGMRDGKCYEFIDYGTNMKIRRVPLERCGEAEKPLMTDVIEDVEYLDD